MTGQFQRGLLLGGGGVINPPLRVVKLEVETFYFMTLWLSENTVI